MSEKDEGYWLAWAQSERSWLCTELLDGTSVWRGYYCRISAKRERSWSHGLRVQNWQCGVFLGALIAFNRARQSALWRQGRDRG